MPRRGRNNNGNNGNNNPGNIIINNQNNNINPQDYMSDDAFNNLSDDQLENLFGNNDDLGVKNQGDYVAYDDIAEQNEKARQEERKLLEDILEAGKTSSEIKDQNELWEAIDKLSGNKRTAFKEKAVNFLEWLGEGNKNDIKLISERISSSPAHEKHFMDLVKYFDGNFYGAYDEQIRTYFNAGIAPGTDPMDAFKVEKQLDQAMSDYKKENNIQDFLIQTISQENDEKEAIAMENHSDSAILGTISEDSRYVEEMLPTYLNPLYNPLVPEIDGKKIYKYKMDEFDRSIQYKDVVETPRLLLNILGDGLTNEQYDVMIRNIRKDHRKCQIITDFTKYGTGAFYKDFDEVFKNVFTGEILNPGNKEQIDADIEILQEALEELKLEKTHNKNGLIADDQDDQDDLHFNEALDRLYEMPRTKFEIGSEEKLQKLFEKKYDLNKPEEYAKKLNIIMSVAGERLNQKQYEEMLHKFRCDKNFRKLAMDLMNESDFMAVYDKRFDMWALFNEGIMVYDSVTPENGRKNLQNFITRDKSRDSVKLSADDNVIKNEDVISKRKNFWEKQNEDIAEDNKEDDKSEEKTDVNVVADRWNKFYDNKSNQNQIIDDSEIKKATELNQQKIQKLKEEEQKKEEKQPEIIDINKLDDEQEDIKDDVDKHDRFVEDNLQSLIYNRYVNKQDDIRNNTEEIKEEKNGNNAYKNINEIVGNNDHNNSQNENEFNPDAYDNYSDDVSEIFNDNDLLNRSGNDIIVNNNDGNNIAPNVNNIVQEHFNAQDTADAAVFQMLVNPDAQSKKDIIEAFAKSTAYRITGFPNMEQYQDENTYLNDIEVAKEQVSKHTKALKNNPDFAYTVSQFINQYRNEQNVGIDDFVNVWISNDAIFNQAKDYSERPYLPVNTENKYSMAEVKAFCNEKIRAVNAEPDKVFERTEIVDAADLVIANMLKAKTSDKAFFAGCEKPLNEQKYTREELNNKINGLREKLINDKVFIRILHKGVPADELFGEYKAELKTKINKKINRRAEYDRAFKDRNVNREVRENYLNDREIILSKDQKDTLLKLRSDLNRYNEGASPSGRMSRLTAALDNVLDNYNLKVNAKDMNELNRAALTYYNKRQGVIFDGPLTTSGKNRIKTVEEIIRITDKVMKPVRAEMRNELAARPNHNNHVLG